MVDNSRIESGVSVGITGLDFSGSLFETDSNTGDTSGEAASVFTKHIGFGFGHDGYRIDVGVDKDEFRGTIDCSNRGFNAFLIGVFSRPAIRYHPQVLPSFCSSSHAWSGAK